ncbi:MAG: bifunctional phosphoribosylaminoimidazolecarboxamide formyltransferase/IMP cyclohydrolase [Chloroflexi bacterium]|nr:bifunctional phosphoribosylaminoimidazolecarboxamide formyltransferase/IMP cyclohydrolase [Chloroflexota bacterium]
MRTALLSVWNKSGITNFAKCLHDAGWRLIASGGTARAIEQVGLPITLISEITGEAEMLAGRVKTLHPAIHAGLLARNSSEDLTALGSRGWEPIDLVVVNLYPFDEVATQPDSNLEDAIENIDIGGVTLLRAAAKNFSRVAALCDPADYPEDLTQLDQIDFRQRQAYKVFSYTAGYDSSIQTYFAELEETPAKIDLTLFPSQKLRYGENPHQQAIFYTDQPNGNPFGGQVLQGKSLSYNNFLDLDTALAALDPFEDPAVIVVKHNSPCGIATAPSLEIALNLAIQSDPVSAFGSVIACNREINTLFIEKLSDLFVECIISPGFSDEAQALFKRKKNLRLLQIPTYKRLNHYELRSISGGFLRQTIDFGDPADASPWQVVTKRQPTKAEWEILRFAWKACQFVKSNAIVLAGGEEKTLYTVGIGGGQPNRKDCVEIAGKRAADRAKDSVLASDAFFPFPDGVEIAISLGVTAIIQPGGSIHDPEVIDVADKAGLAMVMTGVRHFRH